MRHHPCGRPPGSGRDGWFYNPAVVAGAAVARPPCQPDRPAADAEEEPKRGARGGLARCPRPAFSSHPHQPPAQHAQAHGGGRTHAPHNRAAHPPGSGWFDSPPPPCYTNAVWGCSSAGRARQSHCRGQGFEPPHLHHPGPAGPRGAVAQLGERNTGSVEVRGSSPLSSTIIATACPAGRRSLCWVRWWAPHPPGTSARSGHPSRTP